MPLKLNRDQLEDIAGITTVYPYTMHDNDMDKIDLPWHWHEEMEFDYVIKGQLDLVTTDRTYTFKEGEGFFINSNVLCKYENAAGCRFISHLFDKILLSGHYKSIYETKYLNPVIQNRRLKIVELRGKTDAQKKIPRLLRALTDLQYEADKEFETRAILSEAWLCLIEVIRHIDNETPPADLGVQDRLLTMLTYIHEHFQEKLTLDDIAAASSISKRECLRVFSEGIHESPFTYILNYRIETARRLLTETRLPIIEIALACGFGSGAYFSRTFRSLTGMTPGQYRKSGAGLPVK